MSPRTRIAGFMALFLAGSALSWWLLQYSASQPKPSFAYPNKPANVTPPLSFDAVNPDVLAAYHSLEQLTQKHDATTWAAARIAESYEELLIQWWDSSRAPDNAWETVGRIGFDSIQLPDMTEPVHTKSLPHGIQLRLYSPDSPPPQHPHPPRQQPASASHTTRQWRRLLRQWERRGWIIDGSEWRMTAFDPPTSQPLHGAAAQVRFEIHLLLPNAQPQQRRILRGTLSIQWHPTVEKPDPQIQSITVAELEVLDRTSSPFFEMVARENVQPSEGAITIDPLLVQDLTGNGLDEIILLGKNRIYVNQGEGRLIGRPLCIHMDSILITGVLADFDGDGFTDLIGVDGEGLVLFRGDGKIPMHAEPERLSLPNIQNPFVLTAGDVDGDGHLDLWLAQYKVPYLFGQMPTPYFNAQDGFPAFLLRNDGRGLFTDITSNAGLDAAQYRRTYSSTLVDIDLDGDLDLINVSDFAGVDLFLNDGYGKFSDVTSQALPEPHLFGMALAVADLNNDSLPDILAIGMNSPVADRLDHLQLGLPEFPEHQRFRSLLAQGNRLWLNSDTGRFIPAPYQRPLAATGWSWGVIVEDLDNNGDLDIYVVNGHKSHASVRDYDNQFWTHDIHLTTQTNLDPALDLYFKASASRHYGSGTSYGGHQRNSWLMRSTDGSWTDVAWLLGLALPDDCRNVVATDLDGDGRLDIVVTMARFNQNPGQEMRVYRNTGPVGSPLTLRFPTSVPGRQPWGARVTLITRTGQQHRWLTTGDSYRSERPAQAHFALTPGDEAKAFEVTWPDKSKQTIPIYAGHWQYIADPRFALPSPK